MTSIKSLLCVCALLLSIAGIASAKSYYFTLTTPATAGTSELKAGEYQVKVEGSNVVVTEEAHDKSVIVPVKIEHSDKKIADTSVEITNKGGKDSIVAISLGGSNDRLVLSQ